MTNYRLSLGADEGVAQCRLSGGRDDSDGNSEPYLGVHSVDLYVRDQEKSLKFYVETLGFQVLIDVQIDAGNRCIAVSPPNYSAILALVQQSEPGRCSKIVRPTGVTLVTDNIAAKFEQWSARGVHFIEAPTPIAWGFHARFEDIDGNEFNLVQSPWLVGLLNAQRRAAEERRQAERRAAQEMEIAKQVQAQLLPRRRPPLKTLEYAGICAQARQVGGDYYDFLDFGSGHLALVVGDIAGKGIAGALLMANLQASLRSQYARAREDLPRLLESVNQSLCESTSPETYATLFFAEYQDDTQRLRYVNCGHVPALLLRRNGTLERLDSNATVLGLFRHRACAVAEVKLDPGDTLLFYTDGATEANNGDGNELGEDGLIELLRAEHHLPIEPLIGKMIERIRHFCGREQEDDMTLIVARVISQTTKEVMRVSDHALRSP